MSELLEKLLKLDAGRTVIREKGHHSDENSEQSEEGEEINKIEEDVPPEEEIDTLGFDIILTVQEIQRLANLIKCNLSVSCDQVIAGIKLMGEELENHKNNKLDEELMEELRKEKEEKEKEEYRKERKEELRKKMEGK